MAQKTNPKPVIETIINTAAIAISVYGVTQIQNSNYFGFLCVIFAAALEFFKYWGRKEEYW